MNEAAQKSTDKDRVLPSKLVGDRTDNKTSDKKAGKYDRC